jgi:putative cardiolipin synthase
LSTLPEAVRRVATELGDSHIAALAVAYRTATSCTPAALAAALDVVPAVHHTEVDRVHRVWMLTPELPGAAVALALESARLAVVRSDRPRVEVVVTGPDSPAVPIRLTSEVVVGLIAAATRRVTIVSYSVAQIPVVVQALSDAKTRGVQINLIFESPAHFSDGGGSHHYGAHPIYHWPIAQRPAAHALLHAKAVIVDSRDILVTSANLSNLAHQSSLELGLLCRDGGVADRVQRHFDALIAKGDLERAGWAGAM